MHADGRIRPNEGLAAGLPDLWACTGTGDKWVARIRSHGKVYYLGFFDDEVEAAKARDRKAYELHGKFAYLNFPEDFGL